MTHAISIGFLILLTFVAAPAMADTLITWSLNGNVLSDNNTPLTGFFTWDATTGTVTDFDISTQAGTGSIDSGSDQTPKSVSVPAFEFIAGNESDKSTAQILTCGGACFVVQFNSIQTFSGAGGSTGVPQWYLNIDTSETLLNGLGGTIIPTGISEFYTHDSIDSKLFISPTPYGRTATFDPSGVCAGLASACLSMTSPSGVPEPGTLLLLGSGLAGLATCRRIQKRGMNTMTHAISIGFLILLTFVAAPAKADTLINWYLNGNIFTDNNTPVTGFFTWDATTETMMTFDFTTPAGTGFNAGGGSVAIPAFHWFLTNALVSTNTSAVSGFTVTFFSDPIINIPERFSLEILGTSEALLNGFGGTTIGASITEVYTIPGLDIPHLTVDYLRPATFDPSGPCASLASACLTTTVPEPGTLLLLGSGLAGLATWRIRLR